MSAAQSRGTCWVRESFNLRHGFLPSPLQTLPPASAAAGCPRSRRSPRLRARRAPAARGHPRGRGAPVATARTTRFLMECHLQGELDRLRHPVQVTRNTGILSNWQSRHIGQESLRVPVGLDSGNRELYGTGGTAHAVDPRQDCTGSGPPGVVPFEPLLLRSFRYDPEADGIVRRLDPHGCQLVRVQPPQSTIRRTEEHLGHELRQLYRDVGCVHHRHTCQPANKQAASGNSTGQRQTAGSTCWASTPPPGNPGHAAAIRRRSRFPNWSPYRQAANSGRSGCPILTSSSPSGCFASPIFSEDVRIRVPRKSRSHVSTASQRSSSGVRFQRSQLRQTTHSRPLAESKASLRPTGNSSTTSLARRGLLQNMQVLYTASLPRTVGTRHRIASRARRDQGR